MIFREDDNGPFDLPKAKWQEEKHDQPSGKKNKFEKVRDYCTFASEAQQFIHFANLPNS